MAKTVVAKSGIDCNTMSDTVAERTSYIYVSCADIGSFIVHTQEMFLAIQQMIDDMVVALTRIKESVSPSRIQKTLRSDADWSWKDRIWTLFDWTLEKHIQDKYRKRVNDAYVRMVQEWMSEAILLFDAGAATDDLTNDLKETKCNPFVDWSVRQNCRSPENMSRYLQRRGKMTQILDVFKTTRRVRSRLVRRSFGYSMAFSESSDQSWMTTGSWPEILDPASTKQCDPDGSLYGMRNVQTATDQSISELLRSLLLRLLQQQTEIPGTNYLHQHDTMPCNERLCTPVNPIKQRICDLPRRPISANHMPKRFVFFPKLRIPDGSGQIPIMLAA